MNKNGQTGTLRRGLRLGKLGLSLTGSYLGYQAQNLFLGAEKRAQRQLRFQQQASRRVREELGSLKGAVMKLGQLLSLQTQALPPEVLQELALLQMRAPGMHPTLARAQFKSSLGKYPEEVFAEFEPEPFAAASLGQVHRARTRSGKKVAVKIQYPAIRSAIENDFKLLRSATLPGQWTGHAPAALLDEIQRGFLEETDYLNEAKNLEFFAPRLKDLAYLSIPEVHWDFTTDRVLTMSFIEGETVFDFLKHKPSADLRNLIGTRLVEMYYSQLYRLKALHADHHPGNYLFQPDGRIGLVDFGCVKRVSFDAADLINCCARHVWLQGDAQTRHVLGLIFGARIPYARARKMLSSLEEMASLLYPQGARANPVVDFGQPKLLEWLGRCMAQTLRDKLINPEFAFTSRADLGLYHLLHQLGAKVNVTQLQRQVSKGR
ncbi:MAG TPA: AarF/UbiB family protein [Candidatus Binatia bacterium]|nr:AarF/UbiB family protein [Candidatus Binatia bacterium]